MDAMLGNLDFATAYLDDILITSKSVTDHRKYIICVFDKLQEYGFKVKEAKWDFFLAEIKYLGRMINYDCRRPDPDRATAIKDMPAPDNVYLLHIDKNIVEMVDSSKGCALAAKAPAITCKTRQKLSNRGKGFTSTSQVLWMSSTTSLSSTAALNGRMF